MNSVHCEQRIIINQGRRVSEFNVKKPNARKLCVFLEKKVFNSALYKYNYIKGVVRTYHTTDCCKYHSHVHIFDTDDAIKKANNAF